ncbi:alpha/beta fold hydrolase [Flavobacterium sp. H122]|uniref:T9SS type A sorting domain-containing protein n=1 Tax=Flavobacterium sp. H122 TaxID=2529860 RepID=UPI0010AA9090|nr:alpha/beta fold hydrolase [Flavobacterium sp. H122]
MFKKTLYALIFSAFSIEAAYSQDTNTEFKSRPKEFEFTYKKGDSIIALKSPKIPNENNKIIFQGKTPYPIIFIHGLNSSSETWNATTDYFDTQYNYIYGGRFDFCLNADNNNTLANKNFYPVSGADIAAFETSVIEGDYYTVNFNVKIDGTFDTDVLSNQAAIAKQGAALKRVIERILQITDKDKVILVGHSMGGLCSREYIQNSENRQSDGKHHVAKLLTLGTPHGGSNASDSSLAGFTGVDVSSEAIRDLKETYYYSGEKSHFLFGGNETQDNNNMNDNSSIPDFYNTDINCNGITNESSIMGLNQRPLDNLIDFSNIIGRITNAFGTNITTDGVVAEPSSKINQYYPALTYPAKVFYFNSGYDIIENHTELPGYYDLIMQGLDEPEFKELAYQVDINKEYNGYATVQENTTSADNDFYKIVVADAVTANIVVQNFGTGTGSILDNTGTLVGTIQNSNNGAINFSRSLTAGTYFLKLTTNSPTAASYQNPYKFTINATLNNQSTAFESVNFYPNPVSNILTVENASFEKATITNLIGKKLKEINASDLQNTQSINMSDLSEGMYLITLEKENQLKTIKVIKE